jgi:hypothetical protein
MKKLLMLWVSTALIIAPNLAPDLLADQEPTKGIRFYPSSKKNHQGLMISLWGSLNTADTLGVGLPIVKGVDLNMNPWSPLYILGGAFFVSDQPINNEYKNGHHLQAAFFKRVQGLRIGFLQDDPT